MPVHGQGATTLVKATDEGSPCERTWQLAVLLSWNLKTIASLQLEKLQRPIDTLQVSEVTKPVC